MRAASATLDWAVGTRWKRTAIVGPRRFGRSRPRPLATHHQADLLDRGRRRVDDAHDFAVEHDSDAVGEVEKLLELL